MSRSDTIRQDSTLQIEEIARLCKIPQGRKSAGSLQLTNSPTASKNKALSSLFMSDVTTLLQNYNHGQRDFSGLSLADVNLSHVDLKGADLSYSELSNVDLSQANLRGVDLSYAKLSKVDLHDADLRGAMLIGTDLREASLQDANLKDADYIPGTTQFPSEFDPQQAQMCSVKA